MKAKIDDKVKEYFKSNYGAPFIIAFMLLLIIAAVNLAIDNKDMADQLAVYAYYMLVIGVVGQIIAYIRKKNE